MFIALMQQLALGLQPKESPMTDATETPADVPPVEVEAVPTPSVPAKPASGFAGKAIFTLAVAAVFWGVGAALGTGWGLWDWHSGFSGVDYSFLLALAVVVLGLLIGWIARRRGSSGPKLLRWLGIGIALVYAGWVTGWYYQARSVPAIHDISTDLADPPQFRMIELRKDNLDNVPGADREDMRALGPQQRWETLHRASYADIRTVRIDKPVAEVMTSAERIARSRGWDIAGVDPNEGRLEATDTVSLFRFKEDIVLRVRPTEDGSGSLVDMRSVSRVGDSDRGSNAKRIREFLADLTGTVSGG